MRKMSSHQTVSGAAFADFIKTEKTSRHAKYDFGKPRTISIRSFLLPIFLVGFICILLIRLFNLQLISGSYYRGLSDSNRLRTSFIHAPRGVIFDRNKMPLIFNVPGFRQYKNGKTTLLTQEQALPKLATEGATIEIDSLRQYPFKEQFAHVLGYIGQISKEELGEFESLGYHAGDLLGKAGIERQYEDSLSGTDGKKLIEVDSKGEKIRELGTTDPIPGHDITLTLDAKLQQVVYEAMKNVKKGAVVVATPQGEILAMISKPSFDSNVFTMGQHYKVATDAAYMSVSHVLMDSDNQPLLNRAIGGVYPPGSTFKLITAAAGLEEKAIDEKFIIKDTGVIKVGVFSFANWYFTQYGGTDGEVDVVKAIKRSNDIFFYKLGELLGNEKLSNMAKKFGLGQKLGIDLPGEVTGLVPTEEWKQKYMGEPWYLGDSYHYGIGQGYLLTTPLQVNSWTATIANGGMVYQPHLLKNQKFPIISGSRMETTIGTNIKNQKFLSEKTLLLIKEGMKQSCSPSGVAWPLFEFKVQNAKLKVDGSNILEYKPASNSAVATSAAAFKNYRRVTVACKTGTAQHGGEKTLPHAWITLFAPAKDPQIVVTVLKESSGEGSNEAAPIAKKILEAWFSR